MEGSGVQVSPSACFNSTLVLIIRMSTIRQTIKLNANPKTVFDCLTNNQCGALKNSQVTLSSKVGGRISAFNGLAFGRNVQLVADQLIVQAWQSTIPMGAGNETSKVTIELKKIKENQTRLTLTHENVPLLLKGIMAKGWEDYFWNPLKRHLNKKTKQ